MWIKPVKLLLPILLLLGTMSSSFSGMTPEEFDEYSHLSLGADIFPYDWWIRLKSARERDLRRNWNVNITQHLDQRAAMLYDRDESKYLSGIIGVSVTWSGQDAHNPEALKSDPETLLTRIGERAPIRSINGTPSIRMMGTNCAACHVGNLQTNKNNYWIVGGQGNLSLVWLL